MPPIVFTGIIAKDADGNEHIAEFEVIALLGKKQYALVAFTVSDDDKELYDMVLSWGVAGDIYQFTGVVEGSTTIEANSHFDMKLLAMDAAERDVSDKELKSAYKWRDDR